MEEWKIYPLNPNYIVSNLGNIKNKKGHLMTPKKGSNGYYFISTSLNGHKTTSLIHRMVLITFNPIPNYQNYTVDHINGIRSDNKLTNLKWVSLEENVLIMMKNRKELNQELSRLIQKYGYEETLKKIQEIN